METLRDKIQINRLKLYSDRRKMHDAKLDALCNAAIAVTLLVVLVVLAIMFVSANP
ncbi:MAG: hypothetical protein LBM21_03040 [Coriobacteriales bacterium]|jgi:hypothetical protein|nr:hypothetical protein [Coriobacteriales bacterium]